MKKFLSLVLALVMTMSLVTISAGAKDFADDDKITYDEAVAVISEIGVVDGYTDGNFNPTNTLTRQAAAKIICNLILGPTTAAELHADTAPYKDVPTTSEFSGYIAYCAKEGIISGYADGTFKPGNTLTGYAFMKMLLGALGYDANYEQYVGANWSINVAKQAIGIGLNDTLEGEFNGIKAVTREEACLYAFNTLKSTMVAYDNKITANVNGAEVTISNTNAKPVTWKEGINEDGNIKADGFVQFAEEFFPKLVRKDDSTKFEEPANTWIYDKVQIGTFERKDLIVETYTEGVTGKDIYDLLKSGVIKDNDLEVYIDGVDALGSGKVKIGVDTYDEFDKTDLVRANDDDLGATDDGVLTKVYLDTDKDLITIVSINTWLAKATADYSESKEYAPLSLYIGTNNATKTYNVDVEEVEAVADVTKDSFYQVNVSWKDNNNGEVVVINDVEILEDSTVTKFSASDNGKGTGAVTKLTTGGTEYKANAKAFYDKDVLDEYNQTLLTDCTYNVFLDSNGYFIGVELFEGTKNYVFITGFDRNSSNLAVKTATACGIFLDGTMQNIEVNVTDTDKNIKKATGNNAGYFIPWSTTGYSSATSVWGQAGKYGVNGIYDLNQWYTYTVDANGTYTLKPCARMTWTKYPINVAQSLNTSNLSLKDSEGNLDRVYGEDETTFLTVSLDIVDTTNGIQKAITDVEGVYTGAQNVDIDIDVTDPQAVTEGQVYTVYDSDYYVIGAVIIGEARGATANYAYITSLAKSEEKIDDTYYWTFDAVLGGEHQTLTAKSKYHSTIESLTQNTVQELRFDGDYVVSIKDINDSKIYKDYRFEIANGEEVYEMRDELTVNTASAAKGIMDDPSTLSLQGRTLYITSNRVDVGLGLASDCKAVTIQKENGSSKKTNFADVSSAIAHLADADEGTDGFQYNGKIYAVLESNKTAAWIVFVNDTELKTGSQTGSNTGSGNLYSYNAWTDAFGFVHANVTYNRPDYVPSTDNVTVSFQVYANGNYVGSVSTAMGAGVNTYTYPTGGFGSGMIVEAGANIELRNVTFTAQNYVVKFVDTNGKTVDVDSGSTQILPAAGGVIWFGLSTYTTGGTYTVTGTTTTPAPTGTATTLGGQTTASVVPAGNDFVKVIFSGLAKPATTYSVTGLSATQLSTIDATITGADATKTLEVTADASSVTAGTPVKFTVKLSATPADADAYRISIDKLGLTGVVYGTGTDLELSKIITVDKAIAITAADVDVTPVALPTITSVSWTDYTITVFFSKPVNVQPGALDDNTLATGASFNDIAAAETGVTSVTYQVTGAKLAAANTLTLDNSKVTGTTYGGQLFTNSKTTIELNADGTGTLK